MENKQYSIKKITLHPDFQISVISILFGAIVSMGKMGGDDSHIFSQLGIGLRGLAKWTVDQYYTWSSRQVINFVWGGILKCGRIAWYIYVHFDVCYFKGSKTSFW